MNKTEIIKKYHDLKFQIKHERKNRNMVCANTVMDAIFSAFNFYVANDTNSTFNGIVGILFSIGGIMTAINMFKINETISSYKLEKKDTKFQIKQIINEDKKSKVLKKENNVK